MAKIKEISIDINGINYIIKMVKNIPAIHTNNMNENGWVYNDDRKIIEIKENLNLNELTDALFYYITLATIYEKNEIEEILKDEFSVAKFIATNGMALMETFSQVLLPLTMTQPIGTTPPKFK